jgi:DMSO/TMAO reductase YedYZ molybdopterin-dependent catalytic subunit
MTTMTRKTLSLIAGALSLALAASAPARIDPIRIDDGARALLNRVESSPEMGTSIGGGRSVTGEQALLDEFAGSPDPAPASDPAADRSRIQISGVQALLGQK